MNHSVVGFWGQLVGKEICLLKQKTSRGEAIYIDTERSVVFNLKDVILPLQGVDIIIEGRGVSTQPKEKRMVSKEELVSSLCSSCTYFDLKGLSLRVRQMIAKIAKIQCGYIKSKNLDEPATGLSL